ncbi:ATP-binding SpoIIE family protein phosphatase [Alteromonas sp. CYL-A6]|uniref:ATP-binding SpoIIE family protein phosphatase n=1 Tax=Alteromonas nitratireducens TaxID=3390813 RepID=UPI0034B7FB7F
MKILVVDDESINRTLLVHMLMQAGYDDCHEAASGEEAIASAVTLAPDLVLLDVLMSGMSGFEVAPVLKQQAGGSYLPIIFITSLDDKASLVRCLEVGGNDFVTKPFDSVILTAKIRAHERIRALSMHVEQQNRELRFYKQGVVREHSIVEHIFNNALVNQSDVQQYFDYHISPATLFNGDVFLCAPSPKGGLYFLVGDFTGHGLASAIGALPVSQRFTEATEKGMSVAEIATDLNELLVRFLPVDMFFAAIIGEVDIEGTRFTVWSGGMPQVLVKSSELGDVRAYPSGHMALGILDTDEFDAQCDNFSISPGDTVVMYTDGLPEISNSDGDMLDEAGVKCWVSRASEIRADGLFQNAKAFAGDAAFSDDLTIVTFTSQPLHALRADSAMSPVPFDIRISLDARRIREVNPIDTLLDLVNNQPVLSAVRSDLFTVLSEMFNNALEHGLLKLDSTLKSEPEGFIEYYEKRERLLAELSEGHIDISLSYDPDTASVCVSVSDSGDGFDVDAVRQSSLDNPFGRGLSLLEDIGSEVWHDNDGSTVSVRLMLT